MTEILQILIQIFALLILLGIPFYVLGLTKKNPFEFAAGIYKNAFRSIIKFLRRILRNIFRSVYRFTRFLCREYPPIVAGLIIALVIYSALVYAGFL